MPDGKERFLLFLCMFPFFIKGWADLENSIFKVLADLKQIQTVRRDSLCNSCLLPFLIKSWADLEEFQTVRRDFFCYNSSSRVGHLEQFQAVRKDSLCHSICYPSLPSTLLLCVTGIIFSFDCYRHIAVLLLCHTHIISGLHDQCHHIQ